MYTGMYQIQQLEQKSLYHSRVFSTPGEGPELLIAESPCVAHALFLPSIGMSRRPFPTFSYMISSPHHPLYRKVQSNFGHHAVSQTRPDPTRPEPTVICPRWEIACRAGPGVCPLCNTTIPAAECSSNTNPVHTDIECPKEVARFAGFPCRKERARCGLLPFGEWARAVCCVLKAAAMDVLVYGCTWIENEVQNRLWEVTGTENVRTCVWDVQCVYY